MPERKVSLALSMGSAGLYAAVAVAMGFANKATLQVFGLANTLLLLQMCAVIIVVGTLRVNPTSRFFFLLCVLKVSLWGQHAGLSVEQHAPGRIMAQPLQMHMMLLSLAHSWSFREPHAVRSQIPRDSGSSNNGENPQFDVQASISARTRDITLDSVPLPTSGLRCAGERVCALSSSAQAARLVPDASHVAVCWECGICAHEPAKPEHPHVQHPEEDDARHCPGGQGRPSSTSPKTS